MANTQDILLPDIGDFDEIDVIEIMVKLGDSVNKEDPLITLESDKATMEIPSPEEGIVESINVNVGDKIKQGDLILSLGKADQGNQAKAPDQSMIEKTVAEESGVATIDLEEYKVELEPEPKPEQTEQQETSSQVIEIELPDIGDFDSVDVIEILVNPGDEIDAEDPIVTLESDKASMEIPSSHAGQIKEIKVQVGEKISQGAVLLLLESRTGVNTGNVEKISTAESSTTDQASVTEQINEVEIPMLEITQQMPAPKIPKTAETVGSSRSSKALASPSVRKLARELGVDLGLVSGSGPRKRILKGDVKKYTKSVIKGRSKNSEFSLPEIPAVDFSKFGEIELSPLSKIKKLTGKHMQRTWLTVPQVTHFEEADITDLEEFRQLKKLEAKEKGTNLTLITFLVKAAVVALKKYPNFNSSLASDSEALVMKNYFHIGIAVNTDNGLVVPVLRNADQKGLFDIALEITALSEKARKGILSPSEMQGGCFTISSLGGIGGIGFTPIVNAPEVAILGVSKSDLKPVYENDQFVPRLILPFSVSYDHRVIDGVAAAQFSAFIREILSDIRQILL